MLETALSLLRVALERGWTLGLLLLVFCGAALVSSHFGIRLQETVRQWSVTGVLFGLAAIVVSITANFTEWCRRRFAAGAARIADAAAQEAQGRYFLANLAAFNSRDIEVLREILSSGTLRFEVSAS